MFLTTSPLSNRRYAFSLIEVIVSLALLLLLSIITVGGMIMHARLAQSNLEMQRMAEGSRRFVDAVQTAALDATLIQVNNGPAGVNTVITLGKPDVNSTTATIFKQFAYLDDDGNPATIRDNRIVQRDAHTPSATGGNVVLSYCSPLPDGTPIFSSIIAGKPVYEINLRVGDRTNPGNNEDNAVTGRGTQTFLIKANVSSL